MPLLQSALWTFCTVGLPFKVLIKLHCWPIKILGEIILEKLKSTISGYVVEVHVKIFRKVQWPAKSDNTALLAAVQQP